MNIHLSKPFVVFSVVFFLLSLCGCSETFMIGDMTLWPPADQVSDTVPSITPPFERVKGLRDLADRADRMPADQKQQLSSQLAAEYQQEADPLIRLEMLRTLAHFRTESAAEVLRTAVNDSDTDIRIVACGLWGDWGGPDAVAVLKETFTRDSDVDVRLAAARALGKTADSAAVALLGTALDDPNPAMQVRAVQSLRQVTGKSFDGDVDAGGSMSRAKRPSRQSRSRLPTVSAGCSKASAGCIAAQMKTDKQLFKIFEAAPEWVFELTGLPSPEKAPCDPSRSRRWSDAPMGSSSPIRPSNR